MFCYFTPSAQNFTGKIEGLIKDGQGIPLVGATVNLLNFNDSSSVKTMMANEDGKFVFKNLPKKVYIVSVSFMGYKTYKTNQINLDMQHPVLTLPVIILQQAGSTVLRDVVVTSQKKLIERKIDRTIVNVDAMISAAGGNALDVLAKSPGVMVDISGDISLNGIHGILVLIDDKPTYMSVQDLAAYLRSLPGAMLDKIELMANPPSKYDAAGNAIINILLKKNRATGFNGALSLGYSQGVYAGSNPSLNVNYRYKKVNIFGNAGYSADHNFNEESFDRNFLNTVNQPVSAERTNSFYKYSSASSNIRSGIDYFVSSKTTIGLLVSAGTRSGNDYGKYSTGQYNAVNSLDSSTKGSTENTHQWKNESVNLNFLHKFGKVGTAITADLDYIHYHSYARQFSPYEVYLPDGSLSNADSILEILPSDIKIWSAKADYTQTLQGSAKMEAGVKSSYIITDNSSNWFNETNGFFIPDYSNTNHFIYKENINAAYLTASKEWKHWAAKAGLRAENTRSGGQQLGNIVVPDSSFTKHYTILFPTFYLQHKFGESGNSNITFSYGLRVRRPGYQQLNPFILYRDAYTYTAGNPNLSPSMNHIFNLEYSYKNIFGVSLSYMHINSTIYSLTQTSGQVLVTRPVNFGIDNSFNIRPYVSVSPVKGWNLDADILLFRLVSSGNAYGQSVQKSMITGELEVNNQFRMKHGWSAALNGLFPGRMGGAQTYSNPFWRIDAGVQKMVLKGNGTIRASINDIFHTNKLSDKTIIPGVLMASHTNVTDTRRINLTFSYRFGKDANARKRNHNNGGAADEQDRAN